MQDAAHIPIILREQVNIYGEYTVNASQVVDVQGDVTLRATVGELGIQFGHVTGNFDKLNNWKLSSLKGFPRRVDGLVNVSRTQIPDLTHAPNQVGDSFVARECVNLTSLQGAPRWVGGDFRVNDCNLISLKGAPLTVKGVFNASGNPLKSYDHMPEGCYSVQLPYVTGAAMLKLLTYPSIYLYGANQTAIKIIQPILAKYAGSGKKGALACAAELIKAGYKENARW